MLLYLNYFIILSPAVTCDAIGYTLLCYFSCTNLGHRATRHISVVSTCSGAALSSRRFPNTVHNVDASEGLVETVAAPLT